MPTLFIRLLSPATLGDEGYQLGCEWAIVENDGSERAKGVADFRGLSELIDPGADWLQDPDNIVVLAPGEHVLGVSCHVPGRNISQIRRALPFAVEEFVATDIEGMHLASGPIERDAPIRCNLVERSILSDWLSCLNELGLKPGYLISEAELLPNEPGQVSVLFEGDTVLIKTADQAATVDRDNLLLALGSAPATEVLLINGRLTDLERGQIEDTIQVKQADDSADTTLGYLIQRFRTLPQVINLLQGVFEARRPISANWARWRAVGSLAAIWAGVGFLIMVGEGIWAGSQASRLEAEGDSLFREIFPAERRIVNVRRQMQSLLGGADAEASSFTDYLGQLAQVIDGSTSVMNLSYTDTRDELAADLLVRSFDELDKLKRSLEKRGVKVDITSAEQQDTSVRARIRLSPGDVG